MGAGCCSCQQIQLQPGRVHSKKIREIFNSYLKNQGIKPSKKNNGKDIIDDEVVENVERHVKTVAKELVLLMQIDQQFIKKICTVLTNRILDYEQSTELQYLGLVLLREVMETPLNDEKKKMSGSFHRGSQTVKRQFQKIKRDVQNKTVKQLQKLSGGNSMVQPADQVGDGADPSPPPVAGAQKPSAASELNLFNEWGKSVSKYQHGKRKKSQAADPARSTQKDLIDPTLNPKLIKNSSYSKYGATILNHEQQNVQDLQQKEFVFCVSNELVILTTIHEVMCFYNYDLQQTVQLGVLPGTDAVPTAASVAARAGAASPNTTRKQLSLKSPASSKQEQMNEIMQNKKNRDYFAKACLMIFNILLDKIQKTQLVENEATYFDFIANFLFKAPQGGIHNQFGLRPSHPIADGLEPASQVGGQADERAYEVHLFNDHNLFNESEANINSRDNINKQDGRLRQSQSTQPNLPLDLQESSYSSQIRLRAYGSFFRIIKIMRDQHFTQTFPAILEPIWSLILRSQNRIEQLGAAGGAVLSAKNVQKKVHFPSMEPDGGEGLAGDLKQHPLGQQPLPGGLQDEYFDQVLQLGFDIFQYVCAKISSSDDVLTSDQRGQRNWDLLINGVFQYFNKGQQWSKQKFAEFVFILMIFNGCKKRLEGHFDFTDFFVLAQNYYDQRMKAQLVGDDMMGVAGSFSGQIKHASFGSFGNLSKALNTKSQGFQMVADGHHGASAALNNGEPQASILDDQMLCQILENLFRLLMDEIFEVQVVEVQNQDRQDALAEDLEAVKHDLVDRAFHEVEEHDIIEPKNADVQFIQRKVNLMQVLFEVLNLVDGTAVGSEAGRANQTYEELSGLDNSTFAKLQKDSSLFFQIFIDLQHFLAFQWVSQANESEERNALLEHFQHNVRQLFELYLFKIHLQQDLLIKALDHFMCKVQVLNLEMLRLSSSQRKQPSCNSLIASGRQTAYLQNEVIFQLDSVQTILYFIQENLKQYYKQQHLPQAQQRRQQHHQAEGQSSAAVSATGSPMAFMSYGQQASGASPTTKKRMSYKAHRQSMRGGAGSIAGGGAAAHQNDSVFGGHAFSPGSPGDIGKRGLLKLRPEYQVYIAQLLQISSITCFECDLLPEIQQQNQQISISALNLNLQLQNINNLIQALQNISQDKQKSSGFSKASLQGAHVAHQAQALGLQVHSNKALSTYRSKHYGQISQTAAQLGDASVQGVVDAPSCKSRPVPQKTTMNQDKFMLLLLTKHSQKIQYSQKQYLKTYYYSCKQFMLESMLRQNGSVPGAQSLPARDGAAPVLESQMILVLENWLTQVKAINIDIVTNQPLHQPMNLLNKCQLSKYDLVSLSYQIGYLLGMIEVLDDFQNEIGAQRTADANIDKKQPRSPRQILERATKMKTLFIFMMYGFLNQICSQSTLKGKILQGMLEILQDIHAKVESLSAFRQVEEFLPGIFTSKECSDSQRQSEPRKNSSKEKKLNKFKNVQDHPEPTTTGRGVAIESVEQISQKFDRLMTTVSLRVMDQCLASDLFGQIFKARKQIEAAAQQDLQCLLDGGDLSHLQDASGMSSGVNRIRQAHAEYFGVNSAKTDIFELDTLCDRAEDKVDVLGFEQQETSPLGEQQFAPLASRENQPLKKPITIKHNKTGNNVVDLNKKFDISVFDKKKLIASKQGAPGPNGLGNNSGVTGSFADQLSADFAIEAISPNQLDAIFDSSSAPQYFMQQSGKLNSDGQSCTGSQNLQDVHEISISLQQNDENYGEVELNGNSLDLVNEQDVQAREFRAYQGRDGEQVKKRVFSFADSPGADAQGSGSAAGSVRRRLTSPQKSKNVRYAVPNDRMHEVQSIALSKLKGEGGPLATPNRGAWRSGGPPKTKEFGLNPPELNDDQLLGRGGSSKPRLALPSAELQEEDATKHALHVDSCSSLSSNA